ISIILWFFADIITDVVIPGIEPTDKFIQFSLWEVQAIAISLMGLYLVAHGIPDFVYQLLTYFKYHISVITNQIEYNKNDVLRLVQPFGRIIIGFYLMLGYKGIIGFIS